MLVRLLATMGLVLLAVGCSIPLPEVTTEGSTSGSEDTSTSSEGDSTDESTSGDGDTSIDDSGTDETGDAPVCGNGLVEGDEACDDAGESATCDQDCTPVECGDGQLNQSAGEQCDDGGESDACNADCTLATCGDGVVNVEFGEECDEGESTARCDGDCTVPECGDLYLNSEAGEECDGDELGGGTCEGLGFEVGTLACTEGCSYDPSECFFLPDEPLLLLDFNPIKRFDFSWAPTIGADFYRLEQSVAPGEPFVQLGADIMAESISHDMPLHLRWEASYRLLACNGGGCTESPVLDVSDFFLDAVGYVKASNTDPWDDFGRSVALSGDGTTLAVGARHEDSNATGIGGDQEDDSAETAGAVYVFVRDGVGSWSQQAYIKASNTDADDSFGISVTLSDDGNTLAVGATFEASNATGIDGNQANDSLPQAGAVYVFARDGMGAWSQQAYVKASNTDESDAFGSSVALSGDGNTLAVGAESESSNAVGIDGDQADNSAPASGAVYVFARDGMGAWSQQAYVKASNTDALDSLGCSVALSADGDTLAAGACWESSNETGIDGDQLDDTAVQAGAVYVFVRDGMGAWSHQAYVKASNTDSYDEFGQSVALSDDGDTLAVGAYLEDSSATGIGGDQSDESASASGAVYVFVRDGMGAWSQQAYVKASNTGLGDRFGLSLALADGGDILAVGAPQENSPAQGVGGAQSDGLSNAGAVYVFRRDGVGTWSQETYVKASNTDDWDFFGHRVQMSDTGDTLACSAVGEDSNATGIDGDQTDFFDDESGAVYLY